MTPLASLQAAVDRWAASGSPDDENAVLALLDSPDVRALPYAERNRPFLTSSKLKEFAACPYHAFLKYVEQVPSPVEPEDYFVIGQAVDDFLTHGEDAYRERYTVVSRRSENSPDNRIQLTTAQGRTVKNAAAEYLSRDFFPKQPKKRNVICLVNGIPCKAELDHWNPEERRIGDVKTTANITTFNPSMYFLQFGFYSLLVAMKWQEQVEAELYVVDKGTDFSRSHKWIFSRQTLMQQHYNVERLVKGWKDAMESGIWAHADMDTEEGRRIAWASEYYPVCPFCKAASPTVL